MSVGNSRARRGVTLIELLVVVTIIGLIVGISVPSISAGLDSVRLASATRSAASFLNAAVTRAERRRQPVEVQITVKDSRIEMFSENSHRELRMPSGVVIENLYPEIREEGETRRLLLLPGASIPGLGIQLANQHGSRRLVRLDPMTGFPRIERVEPK